MCISIIKLPVIDCEDFLYVIRQPHKCLLVSELTKESSQKSCSGRPNFTISIGRPPLYWPLQANLKTINIGRKKQLIRAWQHIILWVLIDQPLSEMNQAPLLDCPSLGNHRNDSLDLSQPYPGCPWLLDNNFGSPEASTPMPWGLLTSSHPLIDKGRFKIPPTNTLKLLNF